MECQYTKLNNFALQSTCMEVSISLLCLLGTAPNSVFAVVLCSWTTMLFSMLDWSLLRLIPINTHLLLEMICAKFNFITWTPQ